MSLSRRARKQLIALGVIVALVAVVGFGGNQLRLARNAASAERAYKLGTEAFERGDYQETLTQLNRYLPSNQDDADALYMHAKARLEVPQDGGAHYTTALNWARRAADGDPDSVAKRLLILEIRVRSERSSLPELLATVDSVLSLDPTRSDLRIFKADILRASDRQSEALRELRSIVSRDPSSIDALDRITRLLTDQPAEYSQWINTLDQQAADNPQAAAFDIARINARLRLIPANPRETGVSAIAATRALTAYEILTESLLEKTVQTPGQFRAALSIVDEVERAIRLTRPLTQRDTQATQDRLEDISTRAVRFADRHTGFGSDSGEHNPAFVLAAMEWFWTSDRAGDLSRIASDWRRVSVDQPTDAVPLAIESLITMTGALPDDLLVPMPESSPAPAVRLWIELASAARNLRQGELVSAAEALTRANDQATIVQGSQRFAPVASADRDINLLVASTAKPALLILEAETAAAAGDTARAMSLWFDAASQRRVWDRPALQLLETYRLRGNISEAEQMSSEAMLRGATIGTGLSMIESRVEQYALGYIDFETARRSLAELRTSGFAPAPLAVADLRLTITGALRESEQRDQLIASAAQTIAQTARDAQTDPLAAETLVRMLRAADELGVIAHHDYIPPATRETITDAINAQFRALGPESKYIASLAEVAMTGVYGPALSRLTTETDRIAQDAAVTEAAKLEHRRMLTRLTVELARTYQALEAEAEQRARAFAENNPRNANAQLLYIDAILRRGEVQPALTEPLTSALDRLRDILGPDSYTYNLAESRRLYATPATRTPEIARQEIISRLDRFVEGSQEAGASVEALHLASKWWELLPGSLDRRVRYLLRAQRTSPGAWGIYPDLTRALIEDEQWDIAAAAISQWSRQLSATTGLRSQRRDLAQVVGSRWTQIASSAQSAETFETSRHIWAIAIRDAFEIAASTQDPADRLRAAQVLATAPDDAVARARAVEILGFDDQMTTRVDASRPSQRRPGMAVADLTRAAAFRLAEDLLADIPSSGGPTSEQIPAIAGAGQLISENAVASRLTLGASSGQPDGAGPAAEPDRPDPEAALEAMARALSGAPRAIADRAIGLFYAASYNPDTWTPFADQTRSALLTAAATDGLTELEQRALVFPLSQLGEIDAAIRIQRAVAENTDESDRLTDVIAIAEILRDNGQTQAAYEAVLALPESQRARLTTDTVPINPQALVALLELETEQTEQPVTTAFVRRILDRPADSIPALQLTINAADGPRPRQELLQRVSDELTNMSSAGGGEFRPVVANLWYMTAAQTPENHPLRRTLLTEAIARLALVADLQDPGAQVFALQRRAYCEIELGNIDAGIRSYRQAIQLDDSNRPDPATLNNLADALLRRGDPVEATQFASRAIEATRALTIPNSVLSIFYDTLGKSHLGSGNTDAAISALRTALELDDTNAPARISLAEALIEAGRSVDEAKAIINPIGPAAEQALSEKNRARLAKLRID